jgi:hypothetical protein
MLQLKGTINSVYDNKEIPKGSVVRLIVYDVSENMSRLEKVPVQLVQKEIFNASTFPVPYEIEFQESKNSTYFLKVAIEKSRQNLYNNVNQRDERKKNSYGDYLGKDNSIRHHLDVFLFFC